jgi:hypothetical protein
MGEFGNYTGLWDQEDFDPDTIYLKIGSLSKFLLLIIDDDILYISDNTIVDMVKYKLEHPEHLFVSANVINHPRLQSVHNAFGAPIPFAPEESPMVELSNWRTSSLPTSPVERVLNMETDWPQPPIYKHRWLPMRGATMDDCPLRNGIDCSGVPQWQCAAIAHYSFFTHLENRILPLLSNVNVDNEKIYDFGVWDYHGTGYDRWSINFFAAWGWELIGARPVPRDDEQHLSYEHPKALRKRTEPFPKVPRTVD